MARGQRACHFSDTIQLNFEQGSLIETEGWQIRLGRLANELQGSVCLQFTSIRALVLQDISPSIGSCTIL